MLSFFLYAAIALGAIFMVLYFLACIAGAVVGFIDAIRQCLKR